ncbi:coiled-coil domain-containing protein [Paenibacillus hodogayensis]|uniref:Coiled-coil domain-containing protein n=1 Tax=Paenibacillus hodogayensis TaxID=279208 RepID=A0ABV5VQE3_9BACL
MPNRKRGLIVVALGCLLLHSGASAENARGIPDEDRRVLEKGLTVYELDREIGRLADEDKRLNAQLQEMGQRLEQTARLAEEQRKKTERIIRSYYTGQRQSVWLAALNVHSLQDALYVWDQLQLLLESDNRTIDRYMSDYRALKSARAKLEEERGKLADTRNAYVAEKEKRQAAQKEIDRLLASATERARLERELEATRQQWEERGLPLFQQYFRALADVMPKLPELLGQNSKLVSFKGLAPKVTIGDEELNKFLQAKSPSLTGFSFLFGHNVITAGGQTDGMSITLEGRYVVVNKPVNAVRFTIDSLTFNGYSLPESTVRSIERQFDLSFYPNKLMPFLYASEVNVDNGVMTVQLKIGR